MPVRLLHTSDWHLGHTLDVHDRHEEHAAFLAWLVELARAEAVHGLLISGDVFDSANPPTQAQALYFRFLRDLRAAIPNIRVVVTGGNHDSGVRLDAPRPLLDELGVHVVGAVPWREGSRELDVDRLVVEISGEGDVARIVAMPYVRMHDLPAGTPCTPEGVVAGTRSLFERAIAHAALGRGAHTHVVAMGHAFFSSTETSPGSERKIQLGNQAALPTESFGPSVDYVALGHLHLAQTVGGNPAVRYCGSPIPLAMDERRYPHQVLLVDLEERRVEVKPIRVPRRVEVIRIPEVGEVPLLEAIFQIRQLPAATTMPPALHPYLEVRLSESSPLGDHRAQVEAELAGRAARLVRLTAPHRSSPPLSRSFGGLDLREIAPTQVFAARWAAANPGQDPPAAVLAAFHELLQADADGERA